MLNYYESEQEYKPHKDVALISSVIFLQEGDFTGGDFTFLDQDHAIKIIHNRAVIFPSCAKHGALPIQGSGTRISIAQFIDYKDNGC